MLDAVAVPTIALGVRGRRTVRTGRLVRVQLGMRLGSRIGEWLRERAEQLAGAVLVGMAALLLALKLLHGNV